MKVFLSWSGDRSKAVAEELGSWLARVIQAVEPWISSGMEKGVRWQGEVADRLEEAKIGIVNELKKFHIDEMQYYLLTRYQQEMLQGDGWKRLQLRNFESGEKIFVNGVILSNTCDVAPENPRELPVKIIFAPLIGLAKAHPVVPG